MTIVGGLIVCQVLTLFTTPVIYLAFDRLARRINPNSSSRLHDDEVEDMSDLPSTNPTRSE